MGWSWPKNDRGALLLLPLPVSASLFPWRRNNKEALSGSDTEPPAPLYLLGLWQKEVPGGNIFSLTNESLGPRTGGIKGALL